MMKITLDIPDYDSSRGIQHIWEDGFVIEVSVDDDEVLIKANGAGLRSLANHLLSLAQAEAPDGSHIHLDDSNSLEDGSLPLVIAKKE